MVTRNNPVEMNITALPVLGNVVGPLTILLTIAISIILLHILRQWYRLSHIPGPFWAGFSKYWMLREAVRGRQPTAIKEMNDKYGR
jgi:hypothetical protein